MRTVTRNERPVWYANYLGEMEELDEYGYHTGRYTPTYTDPQLVYLNISVTRYDATFNNEGIQTDYHRNIVSCADLGWTEDTVLWIGREPTDAEENEVPYNYIVVGISDTPNAITYRVREVTTSCESDSAPDQLTQQSENLNENETP